MRYIIPMKEGTILMPILPLHEEILPPSDDYVLKAILTHPDAKPALMDLISAVISRTVTDVQIRNNELPSGDKEEKNELAAISKDEHERAKYLSRRKFETDMASNVLTAEKRGVMKVARNMKDAGFPVNQISEISGLSAAEVEKL